MYKGQINTISMAIFNSYVSLPEGDMFLVATNSYPRLFLQGRTVHVLEVNGDFGAVGIRWKKLLEAWEYHCWLVVTGT